ncbi:type II toxin-antitoxin system RelE/ParE family toxin [Okeania sp. SIO2G5]|uniref:type II toxin-antitoxin system RelE/ParE family toxin n=1 Tax=Okeania sp. SIO2G5 TaxID=2607796 RepID=UPI0013BF5A72|nr:type II toxin-antitoxin system RelE/ParE family toxin [Okeania sp. SIO2G5]NEP76496.1 type II toxin-antitoxin system RelE/ParE family toxin [Okeania sp. SIO2G5]
MVYRIDIASVAQAEAEQAFLGLSQMMTPTAAKRWYVGLLKSIESLAYMPRRCSFARENQHFSQEIRQLLYGKGRNTYRVLFTVLDDQDPVTVRILHIRHAAQQTLGEEPDVDAF